MMLISANLKPLFSRVISQSIGRFLHSSATRLESSLNKVPPIRTKNIGIIAHIDAGKTTTTERMLYYSGKTKRIGNVDEGDTVTDYLPSEKQRGITIQLAAISIPWNNHKINIIDTPGHADFTFEVIRSLRVLDSAVTILDGVAGVEAQTEKVWKQANALGIPKIAYVNKMDREGAGFSRTVKEIVQKLQTRVVLCNVPYFEKTEQNDHEFSGVIDIIHKKLLKWEPAKDANGNEITIIDIESESTKYPELFDVISNSRMSMIETLSEFDDSFIDALEECEEDPMKFNSQLLIKAIKKATVENFVTPVFCGSSFKNIGVQPLMDGIIQFSPSPLQIKVPEISSNKRVKKTKRSKDNQVSQEIPVPTSWDPSRGLIINKNRNLTVALAFKVMTHATRGVMTFFRVYSGKLNSNATVINTRTGKKFNVRKLLLMHGDSPEPVDYIDSGSIGVILGLEDELMTGDTLVSHGPGSSKLFNELESSLKMLPIDIPPPLFNSSLEPLTTGDERHMDQCLKILQREDPSLKVTLDEDMGQTIISGMGELHLEILKERLVKDMKVNVRLTDVAVSYKETVAKPSMQSHTLISNEDENIKVEIQLDTFEGNAEETTFAEEEGAEILQQENNIIIIEPSATPAHMYQAIEDRRWKPDYSLEVLQDSIIQGCYTALQMGGPILGFPLHSTVVRIKSWDFPIENKNFQPNTLLDLGRRCLREHINEMYENNKTSFTVLEPYMETKVYVGSESVGEVTHDLTQKCQAVITSIEDENSENLDALTWANEEAERIYLPPDYTLKKSKLNGLDFENKKVILAETPLREMIGYLSRLRSITQGRSVFDMNYLGMRRTARDRLTAIANEVNIM